MDMWFENHSLTSELWFHDNLSWDEKEVISNYIWDNKNDKHIMQVMHDLLRDRLFKICPPIKGSMLVK